MKVHPSDPSWFNVTPTDFVEQVERAVLEGRTPLPGIRTRKGGFTPVLGALLATKQGCGVPNDIEGLTLVELLRWIARGKVESAIQLRNALRTPTPGRQRTDVAQRLFHLLYGSLELLAFERVRDAQLFEEIAAADLFKVVGGLARTLAESRRGDLLPHVGHFMVHAASFLEARRAATRVEHIEAVQACLADWGEDPAPEVIVLHAAHNLFIDLDSEPLDDAAYDIIREGRRAIREGLPTEQVYNSWIAALGWRTTDQLLPMLAPSQRPAFYRAAVRLIEAGASERRSEVAKQIGLTDVEGAPLVHGSRTAGRPRLSFPGGSTIGRSCLLYEGGNTRIAVDMGGDPYGRVPAWSPALEDLDAVLVTHAHHDHIGGLPYIYGQLGYDGPWYAHHITIGCTELALRDSQKLRFEKGDNDGSGSGLIDRIMAHAVEVPSGTKLAIKGVRVEAYGAGHVRGSFQYLLEVESEGRVHRTLVSGDINPRRTLSIEPLMLPPSEVCESLDVLVVEGTNAFRMDGIVDGATGAEELRRLIECERRRPVLLPVMSLGRAQEVIASLAGTPWRVGVLGLAAKMTTATCSPVPPNVTLEERAAEKVSQDRYDVLVASAGCLQGGPSRYFWGQTGWDLPVILTGYLFPGTPAHAHGAEWPVVRFSGHASAKEWEGYVARFPSANKYLMHYPGNRATGETAGFTVPRIDRIYDCQHAR